jgi:hypothetical protein
LRKTSLAEGIAAPSSAPSLEDRDTAAISAIEALFLTQDKVFLALFRSNDARIRATSMDVPTKYVDSTSLPVAN